MPLLPPDYLDCVVAVGTGSDAASRSWISTGFLYGLPVGKTDNDGNALYTVFLVSNKHVFVDLKELWIKLNADDSSSSKDYRAELIARNGRKLWIGHPDPTVDVAALWLNAGFLRQDKRKFSFFLDEASVLTADKLAGTSISEGDGVFLLGFPMGMVDKDRPYVICRLGSIARISDVRNGHSNEILIDGLVFPGNSGGPVVTKPELASIGGFEPYRASSLLGIVSSYVPYQEIACSSQTGRPRMIFEENSGLSSIVPAELIHQTVLLAKKRVQNRTAQQRFQAKKRQQGQQSLGSSQPSTT
jgi:hypothetical protein